VKHSGNRPFWVAISAFGVIFSAIALFQTFDHISELIVSFWISDWFPLVVLEFVSILAWFIVCILAIRNAPLLEKLEFLPIPSIMLRIVGGLFAAGVITVFMGIRYWMIGKGFEALFVSLTVLWILNVLVAIGIKAVINRRFANGFLGGLLVFGVVFIVAAKIPQVTSFPLSLGWSEASRYYYGSLLFSRQLYGMSLPLSFMHPARYLLQAIPFAVSALPLWFHRFWQVLLWLGLAAITAVVFEKRFKDRTLIQRVLLGIWLFVFLFQGAVYYHLLVCVILVLTGYSEKKSWKTLIFIAMASFWAGISRINWFPVPGMIAASLYLINEPYHKKTPIWKYLFKPVLWIGLGTLIAFGSQAFYVIWSGNSNNLFAFGSSFSSDLLWYRLLPNPTFPLGILLGILFVTLPLLLMTGFNLRVILKKMHVMQLIGLTGILVVLLAGGLVVSVKVGGGGDLHNMDAFMVLFAIIVSSICHTVLGMTPTIEEKRPYYWPTMVAAGAIPVVMLLGAVAPVRYDFDAANTVVTIIKQIAESANAKHARILFITQRELLIFRTIPDIPLNPEYEILTLNEMALSRSTTYLQGFYEALDQHTYDLIISDVQYGYPKQRRSAFGEENDLWRLWAGRYLTCEYFPFLTFQDVNIQMYLPRQNNPDCP
jgi:hypothetical protein